MRGRRRSPTAVLVKAAARLREQALAEFLSDWQAKHGKITPAVLAKARAELGYADVKHR